MSWNWEKRVTLDGAFEGHRELELTCEGCGTSGTYDVGGILLAPKGSSAGTPTCMFTRYFRCSHCNSGGPWTVHTNLELLDIRARLWPGKQSDKVERGWAVLFDGTSHQTPAMGEEHFLSLVAKAPNNVLLRVRLGNLLRGAGAWDKAVDSYRSAVELSPDNVEARIHLLTDAARNGRIPEAVEHTGCIVGAILRGNQMGDPAQTRGVCFIVAELIRSAPPAFRALFLEGEAVVDSRPEAAFVRALLKREGDEDEIVDEAVDCLLGGLVSEPSGKPLIDLHPSLRAVVEEAGLDPKGLGVTLRIDPDKQAVPFDRRAITLFDGTKTAIWHVASLRELFRGQALPPPDVHKYPPPYCFWFCLIEEHFLALNEVTSRGTDQEMEEVYSSLRRRPDGRSLGLIHDFLWQAAALLLGTNALSAQQFEAIFGQLARSTRRWQEKPVSKNYAKYLRENLGKLGEP